MSDNLYFHPTGAEQPNLIRRLLNRLLRIPILGDMVIIFHEERSQYERLPEADAAVQRWHDEWIPTKTHKRG